MVGKRFRLGAVSLLLLLLGAAVARAQTCTPTREGNYGDGALQGSTWTTNGAVFGQRVPAGEVWEFNVIGIGAQASITWSAYYALEVVYRVPAVPVGANGDFYIPLVPMTQVPLGNTPILSWSGRLILQEGETVKARTVGMVGHGVSLQLFYIAWRYPASCLPRLLGVESSGGSSASVPPPTIAALVAAAQAYATALANALATSLP